MNGAQVDLNRQNITANNLANATTNGFKEDIFEAQSVYLSNFENVNTGVAMILEDPNGNSFSPGPIMTTGRDLDLAVVETNGWFAVGGPGGESYTRNGSFKITGTGMLVTSAGDLPVMGDGGPISIPPAKSVEIGSDGTISIVPIDDGPAQLVVIDRIKLVRLNPNELYKDLDGLMKRTNGGKAAADPFITVLKGALEGSNVNAVEQMVNMIAANREFEAQIKVMQTVDQNAERLAQILQD